MSGSLRPGPRPSYGYSIGLVYRRYSGLVGMGSTLFVAGWFDSSSSSNSLFLPDQLSPAIAASVYWRVQHMLVCKNPDRGTARTSARLGQELYPKKWRLWNYICGLKAAQYIWVDHKGRPNILIWTFLFNVTFECTISAQHDITGSPCMDRGQLAPGPVAARGLRGGNGRPWGRVTP